MRILHLSDIHLRWFSRAEKNLINVCRGLTPDLTVITGDLYHNTSNTQEFIDLVGQCSGNSKTIVIWGNLERWERRDLKTLRQDFEKVGWYVLENETIAMNIDGVPPFYISGTDDPHFRFANLDLILETLPIEGLKILLSHSPDILEGLPKGIFDLILTGHTHGGQVRFPGLPPLLAPTRFHKRPISGWFQFGETKVFISRGIGTALLPLRLFCPPEAALIKIVPPSFKKKAL